MFGSTTEKQGAAAIDAATKPAAGIRWQKIYADESFPSPRYYHATAYAHK